MHEHKTELQIIYILADFIVYVFIFLTLRIRDFVVFHRKKYEQQHGCKVEGKGDQLELHWKQQIC